MKVLGFLWLLILFRELTYGGSKRLANVISNGQKVPSKN
jgi:hypothetical protein